MRSRHTKHGTHALCFGGHDVGGRDGVRRAISGEHSINKGGVNAGGARAAEEHGTAPWPHKCSDSHAKVALWHGLATATAARKQPGMKKE